MAYLFRKKYRLHGRQKKCTKWTIRYYDRQGRRHEVPGYRDRRATEALANQLERNAERDQIGIHDPFEEYRLVPIAEHIEAFCIDMKRRIVNHVYVDMKVTRIRKLLSWCRWLTDLSEDRVLDAIRRLDCGAQTRNHYLQAVKQFCLWLVRKHRMRDNPLVGLQAENVRIDPNLKTRRALTSAEVGTVLQSTMASTRRFRGLSGRDRAMLYLVAATTGLRSLELTSLKVQDFLLEESPAIRLHATSDKARRGVEQPLPEAIVPELAAWLDGRAPDQVVWPGRWKQKASLMVRRDLADAGIPRKTAEGVFDFHAWRHTYISLLSMTGLQPKVVQDLARHSDIRLTMSRYAHTQKSERQQAANSFPLLFPLHVEKKRGKRIPAENRKVKKHGENRILPTGFEPVTLGLGNRCSTCGKALNQGGNGLRKSIPPAIPPELLKVIAAWPKLPAKVKKKILELAA